MQLRELKYPILTANPYGIGDIRSKKHWNYLVAEGFLDGVHDHEVVFDSEGREFHFEAIELHDPSKLRSFLQLAGDFFVPTKRTAYSLARIEGSLQLKTHHTIDGMRKRAREILSDNPNWRSGVPRQDLEDELQAKIENAQTPRELIKNFIYLEGQTPSRKLKGSKITTDLRTIHRPY
ncbi:MAG: hypothetical protein AAF683_13015 [Pseudomonadota bacterium]